MVNAVKKTATALETIDGNIASIIKKGKALRIDCHNTLIMVIDHYIEHGDYTRLAKLTDAVGKSLGSSMSAAMNNWIARFVPSFKWDDESKAFIHQKNVKKEILSVPEDKPVKMISTTGPDDKAMMFFGDARKLPFYELERKVDQKPFEFNKAFMQFFARAQAALEKNITDKADNQVNRDQVEALRSVGVSLGFIKPEDAKPIVPVNTNADSMGPNGADLANEADKAQPAKQVRKPRTSNKLQAAVAA